MGLEYYYSATDVNGTWSRSPSSGSYYSSLITSPLALSSVTTLPFGTNYKMVAFPYDTLTNSFSAHSIYKITSDQSVARMFHWNTSSEKYFEYATGDFTTVDRGNGYWLLYATQPSLTIPTVTAPTENRTTLFKITLKAKSWNQIGNPYPVPVSWSDILALDLNNSINPDDLSKLNIYTGTSYDSVSNSQLLPFEGGFVRNLASNDLTLYVPFLGQTQQGGRSAGSSNSGDISSSRWNIYLHIQQDGSAENLVGGFGMNPSALLGPDRHDNYNPPPVRAIPEVNFSHPEYPGIDFGNDMVPTQNEFQWNFIPTGENGKESELTWNSNITASGQELYLFDPVSLSLTSMLTTDHHNFVQQKSSAFKIYFGSNAVNMVRPDELKMTGPYPNPVQQNRLLNFSIAVPENVQDAQVSLQFFNSTGELINTINQSLDPGLHELTSGFGSDRSSGIYLYRIGIAQGNSSKLYTGKIIIP
jgi:hypothetical protein